MALFFLVTVLVRPLFWISNTYIFFSWELICVNRVPIDFPLSFDFMSLLFLAVIFWVSHSVILFSRSYIRHDETYNRFYYLLILFIISIVIFVLVPHLLALFLGWDGLGIRRFLLILHYQRRRRLHAAMITILINRLGDGLLLITVGAWSMAGHWYINTLEGMNLYILILLCFTSFTKRAQIPFSRWLPEAIEAPTPVSALVHSSTLVTAGVYLLIRTYHLWRDIVYINLLVFGVGLCSLVVGGLSACLEPDVKKTIAYSTLRQVGFIVIVLGIGWPLISYFHLLTHALFKATLFMSAGCIFQYNHHYQTYDSCNSSWYAPLVGVGITTSILSLNAFPFIAGIYSKELILARTYSSFTPSFNHIFTIGLIMALLLGSLLSAIYSTRIWKGLWWDKKIWRKDGESQWLRRVFVSPTTSNYIVGPLIRVICGVVSLGSCFSWVIILPPDYVIRSFWIKAVFILCSVRGVLVGMWFRFKAPKVKIQQPYTKGIPLLLGSLHQTRYAPLMMDRMFYPIYRIFYLCSRYIIIIEGGIISVWIKSSTQEPLLYLSNLVYRSRPVVSFFISCVIIATLIVIVG